MKIIKNFNTFVNENYLGYENDTIKTLDNYNQKFVIIDDEEYQRYLETEDFIFFDNGRNDENSTLMYDKNTLKLISDNYFATNELYELMLKREYVWASDDAKYSMDEMEKENNG